MSIRTALFGTILILAVLIAGIITTVGVINIQNSVVREAQSRVDHDLNVAISLYDLQLQTIGRQVELEIDSLPSPTDLSALGSRLSQMKEALGFDVLNLCDAEGKPIVGAYPRFDVLVPIASDPQIRKALGGKCSTGTMALEKERLELEGGAALWNSLAVRTVDGSNNQKPMATLFQWFACPVQKGGTVVSVAYGGIALNYNDELVDTLRDTVFGRDLYDGKPRGTVTFFLEGTRVATNVVDAEGRRAIGTEVSDEVRQRVLEQGLRWRDRAWVVDTWYLSAYLPLRDPSGRIVGMLYVGLLESPYLELRSQLLIGFLVPVGITFLVGLLVSVLLARRIVQPVESLRQNAERIARGDWEGRVPEGWTYLEIRKLSQVFQQMQEAIRQRDEQLRTQNEDLSRANLKLHQTNENYMKTLRFVTHELKSPLAAIQTMIDVLMSGNLGTFPEKAKDFLSRIQRNCEELQDMTRDYLNLARAERGELQAHIRTVPVWEEVVEPSVQLTKFLFDTRRVDLEIDCPKTTKFDLDPELIRTALRNYLSNAAKYGREGGKAILKVSTEANKLTVCVWNEGVGFQPEEGLSLFGKFERLQNESTRTKRGSGLGLYLCKQIAKLHGGRTWAESEPDQWARFCFTIEQSHHHTQ